MTTTAPTWPQRIALAAVRFYQAALRPWNPWGCKFYPSCSNYTLAAIEQWGLRRGLGLALRRMSRCRPGVVGGFDPVPDPGPAETFEGTIPRAPTVGGFP